MPRCSSCNKFVSIDSEQEAEVENLDIDDEGFVSGTVHIVNTCGDCSQELQEASIDLEAPMDSYADMEAWEQHLKDHHGAGEDGEPAEGKEPSLEVSETGNERTTRTEGSGRGMKTFYGAKVEFEVKCDCGQYTATGSAENDIQSSAMDVME